ncbi:hypothetical protein OGATHE_003116 [Ogataea polymorpha]|uniref:Septin-type G domain-containing protein n=1 Tax=Ogataea polymorpha TaxID=460523 RepID=A0A9P8T614_9ASCO|nr:hypothetical protein OGATHE_003116 [Ogataea polymorpha]
MSQAAIEPIGITNLPNQRLNSPIRKTVEIDIVRAELEEKNFKLNLNVVDTPGFGDNVNNKNAWQPIIDFIDDQHHSYLKQETQPVRANKKDLRVHAVLYFIRPTGHTLKPLDIEVMKKLGTRANLIPVIAKADTLTPNEMLEFKKRIREIIEVQDIRIYSPPIELDDQAASEHAKQLIESMPFAVIGSEEEFEVDGTYVKGRKYPWGFVDVENDQHCDFRKLRSLLLRTNMLDLILSTNELHYETFRTIKMQDGTQGDSDSTAALDKKLDRFSSNPKFLEEEKRIKRYFAEQLRNEDQRFKQWKQNIHTEKNRLNHDLATLQNELKTLEEQVKALKEKKGRIISLSGLLLGLSLSTKDLLASVLLLFSLLSGGLFNLLGKTVSDESVGWFEFLGVSNRVVDETETGRLSTTESGSEAKHRDRVLLNFVKSRQLVSQLVLGHVGSVWVDDIDDKLSSVQQWVGDDLSGSDGDSVRLRC